MKKLMPMILTLALLFSCCVSAFAMEVPVGTEVRNLNGVQEYVKTYTLSPDADPQQLMEEPFEYEGFLYTFSSITKQENPRCDRQMHTETITVNTEKKDLSTVLEALPHSVDYEKDQYSGTLMLDHTTIKTEAAGYTTKSYTVSETKEIGNLSSNDMSFVPATSVKDGVTVHLQNVDWQVQSTALVDDVLVPSQYLAVATYSSKAYYNAATGYITTAEYTGEVVCDEIKSVTYTLTYVGEEIVADEEESALQSLMNHKWLMLGIGAMLLVIIVLAVLLFCTLRQSAKLRMRLEEAESGETEEETEELPE